MAIFVLHQEPSRDRQRLAPATPGSVLTTFEPGRAVVWLFGEIDDAVDRDLTAIAEHIATLAPHVVVEPSRMTFCDTTLARFLASTSRHVRVTVRRPSRQLRQLISAWGLTDSVTLADFPGPAPALPA